MNHVEDEEKNSEEIFSNDKKLNFINQNSNILSTIINNNQAKFLINYYNSIMGNGIKNNNNILLNINEIKDHNINNYNNIFTNHINNYNIIKQIINNGNNHNNNYFQINNKNNFNCIPYLNQINNSKGINTININNINNINDISNINNNNLYLNSNNINISKINNNNSLNQINNIYNNKNQITNKINYIDIIQKNIIENNMNKNNFINNFINNNINNSLQNKSSNNKNNSFSINEENEVNEVNENDTNKNNVEELMKYINSLSTPLVNFLCTPKGTLEIQKKLGKSNNECKILLINLLNKEGLSIIMKNTYGNYFFQQLIKGTDEIIIKLIISIIADNFVEISKDSSGTFSIQALLNEVSSVIEEQQILNSIKNHEMEMAYHKNATYVLQKIVLLFPDIHRIYLNEIILINFKDLCLDSNGICLIKNFIKTNTLLNNKKRINDEIVQNFVILAESPFGNYGIQYLMENWNKNELNEIKQKIIENICQLSVQQYSSNVVEKAIEIFDDETREIIIKKLFFDDNFIILLKKKFGRFVLHKAVNFMEMNLKKKVEIFLINNINNNKYSNKDKNKVKKFLMKIKNNYYQNNYNFNLNKEYFVRNNMGNICNYNYDIKNTENNNKFEI